MANCKLWFGTKNRMRWVETPLSGADSTPAAWRAGGELLNGGGWVDHSWGSHKTYNYSWRNSSARQAAQLMKSYRDGAFGRGLIYFVDPLIYDTNVLPAQWAAPSINVANEGSIQFKTAKPVSVETYAGEHLDLPVMAARWAFEGAVADRTHKVYIPIPEGYELMLGGFWDGYGAYPAYQVHLENGNMSPVINSVERMDPTGQNVVPRQGIVGRGIELFFEREAVAGGWLEIQALIGRLSKIRSSDPLEFYRDDLEEISRNLFTNPNLVKGTETVEVARNLFTNPRLKGDGTWAEVRRNLVPAPPGSILSTRTDNVLFGGDYWYQFQGEGTRGGSRTMIPLESLENGATYTCSAEVANPGPEPLDIIIQWCETASQNYTLEPGERRFIHHSGAREEYTSTYRFIDVRPPYTDDGLFLLRTVTVEKGDAYSLPFDGSTTSETAVGVDQPEDFRWRWLGEPNASASVIEIEQVAGLTAIRGVAGVSTWEGKPATRLIPTADTGNGAYFSLGGSKPSDGTFTATVNLKAPVTNIGSSSISRRVYQSTPFQQGPQAPNEAGSFESRVHYSSAAGSLIAHNGNLRGGGDVWWTDIGLFAGKYDGPHFDGDTASSEFITYRWAGATNDSQSVMEAWMPRGITVANGVGYLTSEGFEFTPEPDLPATITPATFLDSDTSYTIVMEARVDGSATINGEEFEDTGWTTLAFPIIQSSGTRATYPIPVITGSGAKITIRKMGILEGIGEVEVFSGDDDGYYEWVGAENNSESVKLKRHLKHEVYGPWVGGQGHSGCRFDGEPTYIEYTGVNGGQVGYAATFREVGSWEYV